jgi:hypothetical protein
MQKLLQYSEASVVVTEVSTSIDSEFTY